MPNVIAETDEILVLDKPAGLIVHSDGRTQEPSLADWILKAYPALAGVGEPWVSPQGERILLPGIVHRLDRTTSGVMLIAKTPEVYAYLKHEFKERRIEKTYRAVTYGHVDAAEGKITAEIMRSSGPPRRWYARPCEEGDVRAAVTRWRLLKHLTDAETGEHASYIEVHPLTGRTHQIRVHLASIGHPIVADHLYASGTPTILGFKRPALHAYSVSFMLRGERAVFTAALPLDFKRVE